MRRRDCVFRIAQSLLKSYSSQALTISERQMLHCKDGRKATWRQVHALLEQLLAEADAERHFVLDALNGVVASSSNRRLQ
jgi:hypothetical protein